MTNFFNLALAGAGFTTIGSMVYGCYELLKNEPKPISELLLIKKRMPLIKEGDQEFWKANWKQYIESNTKTVEEAPTENVSAPETPAPKKTRIVVSGDPWNLLGNGQEIEKKMESVPGEFKNKCEEENRGSQNGIWTTGYKNFEKYCTKENIEED